MEAVALPMPALEFNFDSACTSPYISAPSSPRAFRSYYTSALTSPSRAAAFYHQLQSSDWEPQRRRQEADGDGVEEEDVGGGEEDEDFAFEFSGQLVMGDNDAVTATADELFEAGKIRTLKPPPRLQIGQESGYSSSTAAATSPRSPRSRLFWSPRHRAKPEIEYDPFLKAAEGTSRGRDRTVENLPSGRGSRRATRSLSPLRVAPDFVGKPSAAISTDSAKDRTSHSKGGSKKWRFRDLFLFRSASEGRATGSKDTLRRYTALSPAAARRVAAEEARSSSFGSTEGSVGGSSRRGAVAREGGSAGGSSRRGGATPHERHYATNRAMSEEMRRRTFLPYRQGLLGCLGFNPAIDGLVKGFGLGQSRT